MEGIIADAAAAVIFVLVFISVARKGFLRSAYKLFGLAAALLLTSLFVPDVTATIASSRAWTQLDEHIEAVLDDKTHADIDLPEYMSTVRESAEELRDGAVSAAAAEITAASAHVAAIISVFLILRFAIWLLYLLLQAVFRLPVLRLLNKAIGVFCAFIHAFAVIYILCAAVSLPFGIFDTARSAVANSYVTYYLYNNNLLIKLFML